MLAVPLGNGRKWISNVTFPRNMLASAGAALSPFPR
jgi:hypothetical protein